MSFLPRRPLLHSYINHSWMHKQDKRTTFEWWLFFPFLTITYSLLIHDEAESPGEVSWRSLLEKVYISICMPPREKILKIWSSEELWEEENFFPWTKFFEEKVKKMARGNRFNRCSIIGPAIRSIFGWSFSQILTRQKYGSLSFTEEEFMPFSYPNSIHDEIIQQGMHVYEIPTLRLNSRGWKSIRVTFKFPLPLTFYSSLHKILICTSLYTDTAYKVFHFICAVTILFHIKHSPCTFPSSFLGPR